MHPNAPAGTSCNQGSGVECDGAGACVQCLAPSDCGADTACLTHTCTGGTCGVNVTAAGTVVGNPTPGDCHTDQCDGAGGVTANVIDDNDVPADDSNQCTNEVCVAGVPGHPNAPQGTTCNQTGGTKCDGSGDCVQCFAPSDCGADTACKTHTCTGGACGENDVALGTVVGNPTPGDCHTNQCDGTGGIVSAVDDTDVPVDNNQCTADVCTAGVPSHPALPAGTSCGQNGGTECDGAGDCVQCVSDGECPPTGNECTVPACNAGLCGASDVAAGTPTATQTPGDCQVIECDGNGGTASVEDDTDVPADDGNPCTSETCNAGVAAHPKLPALTACSLDGGVVCDDKGTCTNSVQVVRVGDLTVLDGGALSSAATAVFLEERFVSDGALTPTGHNPLALPTATSGSDAPLTLSGTATSEGALALSGDGHYVTLAGYGAIPGTSGVSTSASATVNRVAGRVDASGNVDTSTRISNLISGNNVRSAVTNDGTSFWVGGATSGVVYVTHGSTTGTSILTTPGNVRVVDIFAGQLYGSSGSGTFINVFTIGAGLPTATGQTATSLAGMPTTGASSPYGYALVGGNVLYVADDRSIATPATNGGGVQKWTLSGSTWTLKATFTNGLGAGARGVTAFVTGGTTTIVATVAGTSANSLVVFVDDGVNLNPKATVIATTAANAVFRGVAASPR
jgi:hypothetical protein